MRSLIYLGSALATYGGLLYFGNWDLWVVSIQLDFPMRDVIFMYIIIHNYSMEGYTPIFISSFMWFSLFLLSIFLCMLVRILSRNIYFLSFFLASLHIALIYYFYIMNFGKLIHPYPNGLYTQNAHWLPCSVLRLYFENHSYGNLFLQFFYKLISPFDSWKLITSQSEWYGRISRLLVLKQKAPYAIQEDLPDCLLVNDVIRGVLGQ